MPQVIIKNIYPANIEEVALELKEKLAQTIQCPIESISIELHGTTYFPVEENTKTFPIINIWWFPKPKEIQDAVANNIYEVLSAKGYKKLQIFFHKLDKEAYYEY